MKAPGERSNDLDARGRIPGDRSGRPPKRMTAAGWRPLKMSPYGSMKSITRRSCEHTATMIEAIAAKPHVKIVNKANTM